MNVIIVDDRDGEAFSHALVSWQKLDQEGDKIHVARTLEELHAALEPKVHWPDLVVLDCYFPEGPGQSPAFMAGRAMDMLRPPPDCRLPKVVLVSGHPDIREHWETIVAWLDSSRVIDVLPKTELSELTLLLLAKRIDLLRGLISSELTTRREQVLRLLAAGRNNKQIARQLSITEATVRAHVTHLFRALGVSNRTQAALKARELGLTRERGTDTTKV